MFLAHQTEDRNRKQFLKEHLENTAKICEEFSKEPFKKMAYLCGLCHDIGKYSEDFQKRINGCSIKVEHAIGGAKVLLENNTINENKVISHILAFCIAGHHTGLMNGGTGVESKDDVALSGRLKRDIDCSKYKDEIEFCNLKDSILIDIMKYIKNEKEDTLEFLAFITRYLYSCLVDADFIETEEFFKEEKRCSVSNDFDKMLEELVEHTEKFKQDTEIKKARKNLLDEVVKNIKEDAQIYLMSMPTGSGKTLCSVRASLERIKKLKNTEKAKKRIIYVIPYTSIVEQTYGVFKNVFKDVEILQHHSNYYYECKEIENENSYKNEIEKRLKLASENWDSDFIITTDVQFFESLYNHKPSRMRKIHNMADSIIVFDEVHTMPNKYLEACIRGIGYITKFLNSEAIFLTATMPDFKSKFEEIVPFCSVKELVSDKYNDIFKKCTYEYKENLSDEDILEDVQKVESTLIVVNKRKKARELYEKAKENLDGFNIYHLSTYMTGFDRAKIIEEIRRKLASKEKVVVISTSLIEAGVDIDCERVYREMSGIDSIIQAGGRCNREGSKKDCYVYAFYFKDEDKNKDNDIHIKAHLSKVLFEKYEDISKEDCVKEYYKRYYKEMENRCPKIINEVLGIKGFPFRDYSDNFKFIDSNTVSIVVERDEFSKDKICELKKGSKSAIKALRKYSSNLYIYEFKKFLEKGVIDDFGTGVYVLTNLDYYDEEVGLNLNDLDYIV